MPWTLNGCGATAEFVELLNFGPGPIDIGCYILTDGDFSVTIPPGTILQPGEFYLIAGQDVINHPCANIDSSVNADLNWNTCGCTSGPIPTTGDGFFTDGGSANEQVVLLDPNLNVVDAVIRDLPAESSVPITTTNMGCGTKSFNLNNMNINYEVLGMSAGRGNSFARKLDGDCGWVKDPQQSGNATNNTPSETSDVNYTLTIIQALDCGGTRGVVEVGVQHTNLNTIFPMNYTLAYDLNNDGVFTFADQYTYSTDSTPPSIYITNLPAGMYRITVGSVKGCYLKTFQFTILPCYPVLPVQLVSFAYGGIRNNLHHLQWVLGEVENLQLVALEKSVDGIDFSVAQTLPNNNSSGTRYYSATEQAVNTYTFFRLKIVNKDNSLFYSPVIKTAAISAFTVHKLGPNPATALLKIELTSPAADKADYTVLNSNGVTVSKGQLYLLSGLNNVTLSVNHLPRGAYHLQIRTGLLNQPITFRFVKQ